MMILALVVTVTGASAWLFDASQKAYQLSLTAGSPTGQRRVIAETLSGFAAAAAIDLSIEPSAGSLEALEQVNQHQLDLALIQGGLNSLHFEHVRQVAVLHVEPMHLLIKTKPSRPDHLLLGDVAGQLAVLDRPTINVSSEGSGTSALAVDLLRFFGLEEGIDYQATHMVYRQLIDEELATEELPDAVFTVSSLPSPIAKHLITKHGYRPVELPVANAFKLDWSTQSKAQGLAPVDQALASVSRRSTVETQIPAFTYQVNPPVPGETLRTIGTRLHLVAHDEVPNEAVERLADAVYNSAFAALSEPPLTVSLLQIAPEFPLHAGSADYLRNKTPIITENVVSITEQLLAILGTVLGGVVFVWQAVAFTRRRRRDRQFLSCIERVGEIEHQAMQYECDDGMDFDDLVRLQQELNQIKADMIQQFQSGDIEGADTLSGFLMHVNDANENLTRMILHDREARTTRRKTHGSS